MSYPIAKLLKGKSGSIALWIKTSEDPSPDYAPRDFIGFRIIGKEEQGKRRILFRAFRNRFSYEDTSGKISTDWVRNNNKEFYGKEWRYYIFTWDKDSGLRIYLDGRIFLASDMFKNHPGSETRLETLTLLPANGKFPEQKAFFDELRLFNRCLTEDEALDLYEKYVQAYPVLLDYANIAGSNKPFRVRMLHKKDSSSSSIKVQAETPRGDKLFEEMEHANQGSVERMMFLALARKNANVVHPHFA